MVLHQLALGHNQTALEGYHGQDVQLLNPRVMEMRVPFCSTFDKGTISKLRCSMIVQQPFHLLMAPLSKIHKLSQE